MAVVCVQPASVGRMTRGYRWMVFLVGMVETMLWSGTIFGWASLVHLLKIQGVYSHLCTFTDEYNITYSAEDILPVQNLILRGCASQDDKYVQMYSVASVLYAAPAILIGYSLHHLGLAFTRLVAGLMITGGFILLSLTSQASPDYLWGATVLLAVGGNIIRTAALQFGNLFPKNRGTAMAVMSGIFTPSAGLFVAQQYLFESGLAWEYCCWSFAAASSLVLLMTPFLPRHHIPYDDGSASKKEDQEADQEEPSGGPLTQSLFSVSSFLGTYWLFINLFAVVLFATYFNSWTNKFSKTKEEAAQYSRLFGFANILCAFVSPLPGLMVDAIFSRLKRGKSGVMVRVAMVQAMIIPMVIVSLVVITQISSLFFQSSAAVYVGLVCLIISRPSCLAVSNPFVRARFPANHFNRLIGIHGTVLSILTMLQYPHFAWAQTQYSEAMGLTVAVLVLGLAQPLHLLSRTYLTRVLQPYLQVTKV